MKKLSYLSLLLFGLLFFKPLAFAAFTDVAPSHPYAEAIEYLQANGIIEGYEDGSYKPNQEVNRVEALKIILLGSKVLVPEIQEQAIFPDVMHGSWYAKYVTKAKNLGIVSGDGDTGLFRPGDTVNLAEILKILLKTNDIETAAPSSNPYADVPSDAWFAPYFAYAASISLLPQPPSEEVKPATPVTRGLMAQLMYTLAMKPKGYQEGEASYYGEQFHGKTTASGEVFDASGFTAAHRSLPFGSWIRVKNFENGKEVDVRVNDRGPYAGDNRIVDLSKAAFEAISPLSRGVINVSITPISPPSEDPGANASCSEMNQVEYAASNTFENITLASKLPDRFLVSEVLTLEGTSASDFDTVSAFLTNDAGDQFPFYTEADSEGHFSVEIFFPETGEYQLGLLPGHSGTSYVHDLTVLPADCLSQTIDSSLPKPSLPTLIVKRGDTLIEWANEADYDLFKLRFSQGGRSLDFITPLTTFTPYPLLFEGWTKGNVALTLQGAQLEEENSLRSISTLAWSPTQTIVFQADLHYEYKVEADKATIKSAPDSFKLNESFQLKIDPKVNAVAQGEIILPSGLMEEVALKSSTHEPITGSFGEAIFPASATNLTLTFTPTQNGLHFLEINDEQGLAMVNLPVYPENSYPLLPNPIELAFNEKYTLSSDLGALQSEMLRLVNQDRATHNLPALTLDSALSDLAQFRSNDMVSRKYFGHYTPENETANDLRANFAIRQYVSENLARDSSPVLAEYGFMRSASHRANILSVEWKRAGFGFTEDPDNGIIFTQIFSDDPINFSDLSSLRSSIVEAINETRSTNLSLNVSLNNIAQAWSEKMVSEDFFDFSVPDTTLIDMIRNANVNETLGTYIAGNSSFESAKEQLATNPQIQESRWKKLGIGIKQDAFGIIKITLIYTE